MPPRREADALELRRGRDAATFPHWLNPLPGESVIGFIVRCDWVNRFPLGTTYKVVGRQSTGWHSLGAAAWASGSAVDLAHLAWLTHNPPSALRDLTFLPELERLVGERAIAVDALGTFDHGPSFCPPCWHESRLIRRSFLLPMVSVCVWHDRPLANLRECCLDNRVGNTPCPEDHDIRPPGYRDVLSRQRDINRIWQVILDTEDPEVVGAGYRVAGRLGRRADPAIASVARVQRGRSPLAHLVHALAALHVEPAALRELLDNERSRSACPNASCDFYAPPDIGRDPLARLTSERHCSFCGTRFVGRRILSTFDIEHGARRPSSTQVRRAQRRLRRWRLDLHLACAEIAESGATITVGGAFRRARVPRNANLRAERLGLVAIVRECARRQRLARLSEPYAFARVTMEDYVELVGLAVARDWREIPVVAGRYFASPEYPTPIRTYDEQMGPVHDVLEPLFDRQWARSRPDVETVFATYDRFRVGLSSDWLRDRAGLFATTDRLRSLIEDRIWERIVAPRRATRGQPEGDALEDWAKWLVWAYRRPPEWPRRRAGPT